MFGKFLSDMGDYAGSMDKYVKSLDKVKDHLGSASEHLEAICGPLPKPCPFCGGVANVIGDLPSMSEKTYGVGCSNSDCIAYSGYGMMLFETRAKAIEAWNRRA